MTSKGDSQGGGAHRVPPAPQLSCLAWWPTKVGMRRTREQDGVWGLEANLCRVLLRRVQDSNMVGRKAMICLVVSLNDSDLD